MPTVTTASRPPVKKTISIPTSLTAVKQKVKEKPVVEESEQEQEKNTIDTSLREPFDQPTLQGMVNDIIDEFKKSGKSMEVTVLKQPLELVDEEVTFYLNGDLQVDIFNKIKHELTGMLRKRLNNYKLEVFHQIKVDAVSAGQKLYTSTDKLNYLRDKRPALKELQKRFGLETDF